MNWGNYSNRKQRNKLDRILKQVEADEMPLKSYTTIHQRAKLSAVDKQTLIIWINDLNKKNDDEI